MFKTEGRSCMSGKPNSISRKNLRNVVIRLGEQRDDMAVVVRAQPLAFPICVATHEVVERISESIGLIERSILEAASRFGPCHAEVIDELLNIGSDRIIAVAKRLAQSNKKVKCSDGVISFTGDNVFDDDSEFTTERVHERKFVVNGLTDTLLPVNFWGRHDRWKVIYLGGSKGFVDVFGKKAVSLNTSISVADATGNSDLASVVNSMDMERRKLVGVPESAVKLKPDSPPDLKMGWVVAVLLVDSTGGVSVRSAMGDLLVDSGDSCAGSLQHVCQRLPRGFFEKGRTGRPPDVWPEEVEIEWDDNAASCRVRVPDPEVNLSVYSVANETTDIGFELLGHALRRGMFWETKTGDLLRVSPGDAPTARRVCLIQGVNDLRRFLKRLEQADDDTVDLAEWWSDRQSASWSQFDESIRRSAIPVKELTDMAFDWPDTEFHDQLEKLT